mmetsp:Transcript_13462/g.40697  ORF Transcript_13462/g.40697 Transcript_13462/m.40697 type:complete len:253 (+) Transcript_13462:267-1025(+)
MEIYVAKESSTGRSSSSRQEEAEEEEEEGRGGCLRSEEDERRKGVVLGGSEEERRRRRQCQLVLGGGGVVDWRTFWLDVVESLDDDVRCRRRSPRLLVGRRRRGDRRRVAGRGTPGSFVVVPGGSGRGLSLVRGRRLSLLVVLAVVGEVGRGAVGGVVVLRRRDGVGRLRHGRHLRLDLLLDLLHLRLAVFGLRRRRERRRHVVRRQRVRLHHHRVGPAVLVVVVEPRADVARVVLVGLVVRRVAGGRLRRR